MGETKHQSTLTTFGSEHLDRDYIGGIVIAEALRSNVDCDGFIRVREHSPLNTGHMEAAAGFAKGTIVDVATSALMLLGDLGMVRNWLAEAARFGIDVQQREPCGEWSAKAMQTVAFAALAADWDAVMRYCERHHKSGEGIPGAKGTGGVTPYAQNPYWHFMNLVVHYHAHGRVEAKSALELLFAEPPRRGKYLGLWWDGMCDLAKASFDGNPEKIRQCLTKLAPISRPTWRLDRNTIPEGALGGMALALTTMAVREGADLRPAPDPAYPVELFYLDRIDVAPRAWTGDCPWAEFPALEPELHKAILDVADGGPLPRWTKPAKNTSRTPSGSAKPTKAVAPATRTKTKQAKAASKPTADTRAKAGITAKSPKTSAPATHSQTRQKPAGKRDVKTR